MKIEGRRIYIQPYILPHYSKITLSEYERLGGEEGFLRNQGFYIYRNHRLIINGTWFRLAKYGELSQLVRISVEIPNSLDHIWKITIDKSDAQLPAVLKNRLKQIVDGLKKRSARGYFDQRAGELTVMRPLFGAGMPEAARSATQSIANTHSLPHCWASMTRETKRAARAVIDVVEQSFPVIAFGEDATQTLPEIHQTEADPHEFRRLVDATHSNDAA